MQLNAPCKAGDRVVLTQMAPGDPFPLPGGLRGTVTGNPSHWVDGSWNVPVVWDNGRTLGLVYPLDRFDVFPRGWDSTDTVVPLPAMLRPQAA